MCYASRMNPLLPDRRKRITGINIVPLIDVMTVLIFFFLMSMKFDDLRQLGITPPQSDSATDAEGGAPQLVIAVNKSGEFFVNSEHVPAEELSSRLARIAGGQKLSDAVVIADEDAAMKYAIFAVDEARRNGLEIRLLARPNAD
ncbi:MAG: biopolymer transporter ExbD [Opitutales bacterium]|nr:biopolymer transporter ExbD [Opitutales bacterium]